MNTVTVNTSLSGGSDLKVSAESELMKHHQPALPVTPEHAIYAVHDAQGRPIVIGFSPDGDFYAVHHADDDPTGWTQVDLSPSLKAYGDLRDVVAAQLPNGYVFLAAAVRRLDDATTDDLFVAGPLDPDLSKTDWAKLDDFWTRSTTQEPGTTIERIFVGPDDDGQGNGIPLLAVSLAGSKGIGEYLVQADVDPNAGTITWSWRDFPTPTAKARILDYAIGTVSDLGSGVYVLYEGDGGVPWLIFKTLPNKFGRDFDRQFDVPEGAAALQSVVTGGQQTTGLLVGGSDGIHYFAPENQEKLAKPLQIATAQQVPDIRPGGLVARADQLASGTIAVWALSGENLYYLHDHEAGGWSTPLFFRKGVARIAPLRNQQRYANELVYVDADVESEMALYYMWQDPSTTLWKRDHIPLHDTGHVLEFSCYTSVVSLSMGDGAPLTGQQLHLSADSWQRVIVNGVTHIVDRDTPVAVDPDARGTLTLITKVNDLAAPVLHLTANFFPGTLDVDPAHKVHAKLSAVNTAGDIPVLPKQLPQGFAANDVASTVHQLMQFHPKTGGPPADAVSYRTGERPPMLSLARVPTGRSFGVSFDGGVRLHDASSVAALRAQADAGTIIKDAAGDVFEFLNTVIDDVKHVVVTALEDGVEFLIKIGNELRRFVADNFPAIYKALTWFFQKLKVAFEALIRWLGHLFGWDDIWQTHKVLAALLTNVIDYGVHRADAEIEQWKQAIEQMLDGAKEQVKKSLDSLVLPPDIKDVKPRERAQNTDQPGTRLNAPAADWSRYHLQYSGVVPPAPTGSGGDSGLDPLSQFYRDVIEPTVTSLWTNLEKDIEDLQRLLNGSDTTVADVLAFISDLVDTIFDPLKTLIVGILTFVEDLIGDIQGALEDPLDIPFLSAFYKWIVGVLNNGEKEDLTAVNAISLLVAVPYTYLYKLAKQEAPFEAGSHGLDDAASIPRLFESAKLSSKTMSKALPTTNLAVQSATPATAQADTAADKNDIDPVAKNYLLYGGFFGVIAGLVADVALGVAVGNTIRAKQEGRAPLLPNKNLSRGEWLKKNLALLIIVASLLAKAAATFPVSARKNPSSNTQSGIYFRIFSWVFGLIFIVVLIVVKVVGGESKATGVTRAGFSVFTLVFNLISDGFTLPFWETWVGDGLAGVGGAVLGAGEASENVYALGGGAAGVLLSGIIYAIQTFTVDFTTNEGFFNNT